MEKSFKNLYDKHEEKETKGGSSRLGSTTSNMKKIKNLVQMVQFVFALIALATTLMGLLKNFMDWSNRFDYEK